jgi:hypothetical protein
VEVQSVWGHSVTIRYVLRAIRVSATIRREEPVMNTRRFWFLTALAGFGAASRLLHHPPNFSPMTAVALFGAATIPGRWLAVAVPLGSLLASDGLLHLTYLAGWQPSWGFYQGQWVVYACALATVGLGFLLRRRRTVLSISAATLASSLLFFLSTNFVFAHGAGSLYPRTVSGLLLSYEMALPFFRNSLAGDAFYTSVLFGGLALAEARVPSLRSTPPAAAVAP